MTRWVVHGHNAISCDKRAKNIRMEKILANPSTNYFGSLDAFWRSKLVSRLRGPRFGETVPYWHHYPSTKDCGKALALRIQRAWNNKKLRARFL